MTNSVTVDDDSIVGIVTLPGSYNFGNRLQLFALQRIYRDLGYHAVELILSEGFNAVRSAKRIVKRVLRAPSPPCPESLMSSGRKLAFERFSSNITSESISSLKDSLLSRCDWFSVGSDQAWNPDMIRYNEDWYFLEFAPAERRLALAPSIGLDELNGQQARRLRKGVRGFARLSVREDKGAELIKGLTGRDAEVICDPTLVLPADEWRRVSDDGLTPEGPYVLAYLLGDAKPETQALLDEVTRHGELPVVPLSDRQKAGEPDAGPAEFISLVDHAAHVVTDSFHASVFSSILHTPLTIVRRGGGGSMFSRLETLSRMLGLGNKILGSPEFDFSCAGEFTGVDERISVERERFLSYLRGCLDA